LILLLFLVESLTGRYRDPVLISSASNRVSTK
jgi:hypothetical protein